MTRFVTREEIEKVLPKVDAISAIEEGMIAYSLGNAVVPPVGELVFEDPPGETHIKYGYIKGDDYYVIKIGCGFYENYKLGLPTRHGLMLVLEQKTGRTAFILDDKGLLTDERTAAAGAVVAKYLAPENVERIGIVGAGGQGRVQAKYLGLVLACRDLTVWGLNQEELDRFKEDVHEFGFNVKTTLDIEEVTSTCNYIVTATPSEKPLITASMVRKGTHISAFGSDTPEKIELEPNVLAKADLIYVDSLSQSQLRGELCHARNAGVLEGKEIHEIGKLFAGKVPSRTNDEQISIVDLTGVAVQDVQICKIICEKLD